jgi:hypothetical protein
MKWAELIPHIESRLNNTSASAAGFTHVELMIRGMRPNVFEDFLPKNLRGDLYQKTYRQKSPKPTRRW